LAALVILAKPIKGEKDTSKVNNSLLDLTAALERKNLIQRIFKEPDEDRSKLKTIIDLTSPTTPGAGYEIIKLNEKTSIDLLALGDDDTINLGAGIAYDLNKLNMDVGVGAVRDVIGDDGTKIMAYLGIHF
jgi:hypothetical protein